MYDQQEIVMHLLVAHGPDGPWEPFADVPYGEQMWVGTIEPAHWFCGYVTLYGEPSTWSELAYSGDAPVPPPPPPTKPGKGWGRKK